MGVDFLTGDRTVHTDNRDTGTAERSHGRGSGIRINRIDDHRPDTLRLGVLRLVLLCCRIVLRIGDLQVNPQLFRFFLRAVPQINEERIVQRRNEKRDFVLPSGRPLRAPRKAEHEACCACNCQRSSSYFLNVLVNHCFSFPICD